MKVIIVLAMAAIICSTSDPTSAVDNQASEKFTATTRRPFNEDDITFRLYTRVHPLVGENLTFVNATDEKALLGGWMGNFFMSKKTVIITHGFMGSGDGESCYRIRDAHLYMADVNVVVVDWSPLAKTHDRETYEYAVNNTAVVGQRVAWFIDYLMYETSVAIADFHLIGFSLGAHVMGQAGSLTLTGKVGRITGLDPAKPRFESKPLGERLDDSDAMFVEIIHTEASYVAFQQPIGHVDFYPNGGKAPQPGCLDLAKAVHCSHEMAFRLYVAAVYHPQSFVGERCESWGEYCEGNRSCAWEQRAVMGPDTDTSARGQYFLDTVGEPPYILDLEAPEFTAHPTASWKSWDVNDEHRWRQETPQAPPPPPRENDEVVVFDVAVGVAGSTGVLLVCLVILLGF